MTIGPMAIAGTAFMTSVSSTVLLALVTSPYVSAMYELSKKDAADSAVRKDGGQKFKVTTMNILGSPVESSFHPSDVQKKVTHPFATFSIKSTGKNYYVFDGQFKDENVKALFAKTKDK